MMTKEQFFTFKSDMKKGMRIITLRNSHVKAYWNDGFATQEDQDKAIKKSEEEIQTLKDSIARRVNNTKWDSTTYKWVPDGTTRPIIIGESAHQHWAYYCAKHQLDEVASVEYIESELNKMTKHRDDYYGDAFKVYERDVKPILDDYEKIVCSD